MLDLQFSDPLHYFTTAATIDPMREIDFNDFFLVVRNGSTLDGTNSALLAAVPPVEEVYQIIGTNFTFLRSRDLGADTTIYTGQTVTR